MHKNIFNCSCKKRKNPQISPAVRRYVVPLEQDKISTKSIGKLIPMMKEICATGSSLHTSRKVSPRNVCSFRIKRINCCTIKLILDELKRIAVETILCRSLTCSNWARLHLEMPLVMGCKHTLNINYRAFFVTGLNNWR